MFGDAVDGFLREGLMGKAIDDGRLAVHCTDPRDFTHDRHRTVDDTPFGGGPGMVMKAEPVVAALEYVVDQRGPVHTILVTPTAPRFDQAIARRLAGESRIAILCGRYEGIDDRVREGFVDECLSLGDFVLNGGELAALAIIEAVGRLSPGVLGNPESSQLESFADAGQPALEHPQYTRPEDFRGRPVPAVLRSGDHQRIARWRRQVAWLRTARLRPDLLSAPLTELPAAHPLFIMVDEAIGPAAIEAVAAAARRRGARVLVLASREHGAAGAGKRDAGILVVDSHARARRVLRSRLKARPEFVRVQRGRSDPGSVTVRSGAELVGVLGQREAPQSGESGPLPPIVLVFGDPTRPPEGEWAADLALDEGPITQRETNPQAQGLAITTPMIDPSQPQSIGTASTGEADTPHSPDAGAVQHDVSRALALLGRT